MASRLFTVDLDLGLNKAKRFTFEDFATNPDSDLSVGRIIYFTGSGGDQNHLRAYDGTAWKTIAYTDDVPDLTGVFQPLDTDLTNIAALTGTAGFLKTDGENGWSVDTNTYLTSSTGVSSITGTTNQITVDSSTGDVTLSIPSVLQLNNTDLDNVFMFDSNAQTFTFFDQAFGGGNQVFELSSSDTNAMLTSQYSFNIESTTAGVYLTSNGETYLTAGTHLVLDAADTIYLKDNGTDYLSFERSYTGAARITATDDINIKSTNGDIVLYPGDQLGGIGKAYIGYGNANPATAYGVAFPEHEIITVEYVTGYTNVLSANQFVASHIDDIAESFGGYTFVNDGGNDSGMFSTGDGEIKFYANAQLIASFNADAFTMEKDLIVTGDLTVNGNVTTLNTATMNVEDNIFLLNSNFEGIPSLNAGLEVERGDYTNTSLYWNEAENRWYVDVVDDDNSAFVATGISLDGHTHTHDDITDFSQAVEDQIDAYLSTIESSLVSDGFTKKYTLANPSITVSGGEATWTITHGLGADVIAQFREAATNKVVEADIQISSTTVVIKWNSASNITAGDYKVVVIG